MTALILHSKYVKWAIVILQMCVIMGINLVIFIKKEVHILQMMVETLTKVYIMCI